MEKTMSVEDKIRRAEEIYYKRREMGIPRREEIRIEASEKKDIKLFKKMIKQIIICIAIYGIFYLIINNNYIFSEDFTNKTREILATDINFSEIYSVINTRFNDYSQKIKSKEEINEKKENEDDMKTIQNNDENIGGAEEQVVEEVQNEEKQEEQPISQMEQDVNYIKNSISFIKPVNGVITSEFGLRNPTTSSVPKNHTGTDIAASVGTKIVSATDGKVILNSLQGDFGKHLKIQEKDVIIVYAHCNKLYVKEGEFVKQGQEIAEVGSTGNVTGPHLHFEIRYQNRYINPQMILEL